MKQQINVGETDFYMDEYKEYDMGELKKSIDEVFEESKVYYNSNSYKVEFRQGEYSSYGDSSARLIIKHYREETEIEYLTRLHKEKEAEEKKKAASLAAKKREEEKIKLKETKEYESFLKLKEKFKDVV